MWAMLLGLATVTVAMFFVLVERIAVTVILFIMARRQKMKAPHWVAAGILFGLWSFLPYAYARIKISKNKCSVCGFAVSQNSDYCANCGEKTKKIDDGMIIVKFIFLYLGVCVAIAVFDTLIPIIFY